MATDAIKRLRALNVSMKQFPGRHAGVTMISNAKPRPAWPRRALRGLASRSSRRLYRLSLDQNDRFAACESCVTDK